MLQRVASCVVLVRPDHFGFNPETAATNVFQNKPEELGKSDRQIRDGALAEFNGVVDVLSSNDIEVLVLQSDPNEVTPDGVFPNNWFSLHQGRKLVVYPMLAANRRKERQTSALLELLGASGRRDIEVLDLSKDEVGGNFLEGTGSLVLDRTREYAFAMESQRTVKEEFDKWCALMNYKGIFFHAYDERDLPIYHTNVVMSIGDNFVVACLDSVKERKEREVLINIFKEEGREFIPITFSQVRAFCGNILQLRSKDGKMKIVMSENAKAGFTDLQLEKLQKYGEIVAVSIPIIEKIGGGSARCMLAEVFI